MQKGAATLDPLRGRTEAWTTFATDWAAVTPVPIVVSEAQATQTFVVQMRYRRDVEANHQAGVQQRIVTDKYTLKVLEVVNIGFRNRDMDVHCAEATPAV